MPHLQILKEKQKFLLWTTVNIYYLEFVNFSLGASGMVRQNLQNDGTVSLSVLFKPLPVRLYKTPSCCCSWKYCPFVRFSGSSRWWRQHSHLEQLTRAAMSALIPSLIPREKYFAQACSCLFDHVYSVLPDAVHQHISSPSVSILFSTCPIWKQQC